MKNAAVLFILLIGFFAFAKEPAISSSQNLSSRSFKVQQKKYFKNVVQVEALGRSFLYGLGYERMLNPEVSLGIGFSYTSLATQLGFGDTTFQLMSVPLYVNYYLNPGRHNFVLGGGVNIFSFQARAKASDAIQNAADAAAEENNLDTLNWGDLELSGSAVIPIPQAGMGYEFRSRSGFMTRLNIYGMYALGVFVPWAGISVGAAF